MLDTDKALIVRKRGGGERTIPAGKWFIDRNTEVGEPADIYERKPHNGYKWIQRKDIIGQ